LDLVNIAKDMKQILFAATIVISLIIINSLARSIYDLWQKKDLIAKAQKDLIHQKQENDRLKSEALYTASREFIEKEARDKLLLVKPGEQQVLVPQNLIKKKAVESQDNTPNWKKWWELFF
jgi:cell division protein FtsB